MIKLVKQRAFIGAESDGKGNWKWNDGSKWWQPEAAANTLQGKDEIRIIIDARNKHEWHDWGDGTDKLCVVCSKDAVGVWVRQDCSTQCGLRTGAVVCTTSSCDPDTKPAPMQCPKDIDCGSYSKGSRLSGTSFTQG